MRGSLINRFLARWLLVIVWSGAPLWMGCQQKMADQPSFGPLEPTEFFGDGRSARPLVAGTVARGYLRTDVALFTGRRPEAQQQNAAIAPQAADAGTAGAPSSGTPPLGASVAGNMPGAFDDDAGFVDEFPIPVDEAIIRHGYNRYMIYCVVCHDALGTGQGKIVERGYSAPPSFHIERLRTAPVGRLFAVVSEGYGSMPSYADQISPEDRWAIIAYVRALQLSQHFPANELTDEMRQRLSGSTSEPNVGTDDATGPSGGMP